MLLTDTAAVVVVVAAPSSTDGTGTSSLVDAHSCSGLEPSE